MSEQYPSVRPTTTLSSLFNGDEDENNSSTIKTTEETDTSFTTQSSLLVVDEPSTILTTSIFPTTTEQYPDGRLSNSFQTTDGKAAEFPTITTTTKDTLSFISTSTSSVPTASSQEQEHYYVQQNTHHLSSSITTTATTLKLQKQELPNITMENDDMRLHNYKYTSYNTSSESNSNTTLDIASTNNTTTTDDFLSFPNDIMANPPTVEFQIYASLLCLIACIGVLSNSSIIHLILKEFQLKIKTHFSNMIILSLAIADVIACILVAFPASVTMSIGKDPSRGFLCGIQCMANYLSLIASIGTLAIVSIDRFIAVRWPLHYHKWVTPNRLRTALVTVWIQALIASTHAVSHTKTVEYEDAWKILCVTNWSNSTDSLTFGIFSLIWFIIGPAVIIIWANALLIHRIFIGTSENINPVMALKRQNAMRGMHAANALVNVNTNENRNEMQLPTESRFTVYPVYPEPPKPVNTWANMTSARFNMRPSSAPTTNDEGRVIELFTRVVPNGIINNNRENTNAPGIQHISGSDRIANTDVTNDQVLKCYLAVISVYFILHFPTFVLFIIKQVTHTVTPGGISYFTFISHMTASVINPFLYAALRRDFRKSYHKFLTRISVLDFNR